MSTGSGGPELQPGPMERSTRYPRYNLEEAFRLAKATFELGARHVHQHELAVALGYKGVANGAFKGLRAAARYFGFVEYSGNDYIEVVGDWIHAFHADEKMGTQRALAAAALAPDLYKLLFDKYQGKMLPPLDRLARELYLNPVFGIRKDVATGAATTFIESMKHAGLIDEKGFLRAAVDEGEPVRDEPASPADEPASSTEGPVEQLKGRSSSSETQVDSHDRLEIRLPRGRKAYLLVPAPGTLSPDDKQRVKGFVDLILEDEE